MKTDDLIASLSAELTPTQPGLMTAGFLRGVTLGVAVTIVLFVVFWGSRPDVGVVLRDAALFVKSALPLLLGMLALPWVLAQARPAGETRSKWALVAVPVILGLTMLAALTVTPSQGWQKDLMGYSILTCLTSIPILSGPILAGALLVLRHGAPEHPTRCGAVAGLMAAGFGAAIYSLYCIEDSPLFYGVWYTLSVVIVMLTGAVVGGRLLRW